MTVREKQLAGIIVTMSMIMAGLVVDNIEQTYYCDTEDSVKEFVRCSSTMKTCYDWSGKGDRCVDGVWKPIKDFMPKEKIDRVKTFANNKGWDCDVIDNEIWSYTKCYSGNSEGYLGELI